MANVVSVAGIDQGMGQGAVVEGQGAGFEVSLQQPASADTTVMVRVFTGAADSATENSDYFGQTHTVTIPAGQTSTEFFVGTVDDAMPEPTETYSASIIDVQSADSSVQASNRIAVGQILDNDETQVADVGRIESMSGTVMVRDADGVLREVQPGDPVFANSIVETGKDGEVIVLLADGTRLEIGSRGSAMLDSSVFAHSGFGEGSEYSTTAETIRQAFREGRDPGEVLDPTAAGNDGNAPASDGGGNDFVQIDLTGQRVTPETGFPTTGIGFNLGSGDEDLLFIENRDPVATDDAPGAVEGDGNDTGAGADFLTTGVGVPLIIQPSFLLANDFDPDGDPLTIVGVGNAVNGTVSMDPDTGLITFIPGPGFDGEAKFTYDVEDPRGGSATANVTVDVIPTNKDPLPQDDSADPNAANSADDALTTDEDTPLDISPATLLANDIDPDGDPLTIIDVTDPPHGTLDVVKDGDGNIIDITYTPDPDYNGPDEFFYTVDDGNGGTAQAKVSVNVLPVGTLSIDDVTVNEDAGTATFTVSLIGGTGSPVTFDYQTTDDTAKSTDVGPGTPDYTETSGTHTFPANPGDQSVTITVPITNDDVFENPEQYLVNLTVTDGKVEPDSDLQGIGTILEDQQPPVVNINDIELTEGGAGANFTISLDHPTDEDVTVDWDLSDITAQLGPDYTGPTSGTATIPAGSTEATIDIPGLYTALQDDVFEPTETFKVDLSNIQGGGAVPGDVEGIGTILEDDAPPVININDITINEEGETSDSFTVSLDKATYEDVTVKWDLTDITAILGSDYTGPTSGTATIPAGSTTATIDVPGLYKAIDDNIHEMDETFRVNLSDVQGGDVVDGDMEGIGTIVDNDPDPVININDITINEAGETSDSFTISLSNPTFEDVTVDWTLADIDAVLNTDYTGPTSGTATIKAGDTTATIDVPGLYKAIDDNIHEMDETFKVTLSNPQGGWASLGDAEGIGTIIDNDPDPLVSINDIFINEEGETSQSFVISINQVTFEDVEVDWTLNDSFAATLGDDYTGPTSGTAIIKAGDTTATQGDLPGPFKAIDDAVFDPNETFRVEIDEVRGGWASIGDGQGLGTIIDNDTLPAIRIDDITITEDPGGTPTASFTISIDSPPTSQVTVQYNLSNLTASDADYDPDTNPGVSGTATIPAGTTTVNLSVPLQFTAFNDNLDEPTEQFQVTLSNVTGPATIADPVGIGSIIDDDPPPELNISDGGPEPAGDAAVVPGAVTEGDPLAPGQNISFDVTLSAPSGQQVKVNYTVNPGTAGTPGDYNNSIDALSGTLTFAPGETKKTITLDVTDDLAVESTENFTVTLSAEQNATINDGSGTGTILDNDSRTVDVEFFITGDTSVNEGSTANYTIGYTGGPLGATQTVSVDIASIGTASGPSGAAATPGTDYEAFLAAIDVELAKPANSGITRSGNTLTFDDTAPTSFALPLDALDDVLTEGPEDYNIALSSASGTNGAAATISPTQGDVTTTINDTDSIIFNISQLSPSVNEGAAASYTVSYTGTLANGATASIDLSTAGTGAGPSTSAATPDTDYQNLIAAINAALPVAGVAFDGTNTLTFTGPANSFTFTMDATVDGVAEGNEDYTVDLANPIGPSGTNSDASIGTGTVTTTIVDVPSDPPVADPVLADVPLDTVPGSVTDSRFTGVGPDAITQFKAFSVGSGLDGDITVAEGSPDLGGQDDLTTEPNLDFVITQLPTYGTVYIDVGNDDPTGADWIAIDASKLAGGGSELLFSTSDAVYWAATEHEACEAVVGVAHSIGGANATQVDWEQDGVTVSAKTFDGSPGTLTFVPDGGSGKQGMGVSGGSPTPDQINNGHGADDLNSEAIVIDFGKKVTNATVEVGRMFAENSAFETGTVRAFNGATLVATYTFGIAAANADLVVTYTDAGNGVGTFTIPLDTKFYDKLEFTANQYFDNTGNPVPDADIGGGNFDSSDYYLRSIDYNDYRPDSQAEYQYKVIDEDNLSSDPVSVVIRTEGAVIQGTSGNDTIDGADGVTNDGDLIIGGDGNDILTGLGGADVFYFAPDAAIGSTDTITDFTLDDGDVLNIKDLLNDVTPETGATLAGFVEVTSGGTDTTIKIDTEGGSDFGSPDHTIVLQNVDLTTLGGSQADILQNLLDNGNIDVN